MAFKMLKNNRGAVFTTIAAGITAAAGALGATAATAATIGTIGAGIAAAGAAYGAISMVGKAMSGGGGSSAPAALPAPPSQDRAAQTAKESIDKKRRAQSRNKTVFTGALGVSEEQKSGIALKTLTGA